MTKLDKNKIQQTLEKIPGITIITIRETKTKFEIRIIINGLGEVKKTSFYLDYAIEIIIPKNYPLELPICSEYGERRIRGYHHLFEKGNTFCLGTNIELRDRLSPSYRLENYVDIITEFLVIYEYYKRYNTMPVSERSHGNKGILEGYKHLLNVESKIAVHRLINNIPINNRMRNKKCPCGSEKLLKKCHFNQLLKLSNNPLLKKQIKHDRSMCMLF